MMAISLTAKCFEGFSRYPRWRACVLIAVLVPTVISGCGGGQDAAPGAAGATGPGAAGIPSAPPAEPLSETDQLIADLTATLRQLQQNEPQLFNALKQYRVELAQRQADLRSSLARSGLTLEQVRAASTPSPTDTNLLRVRRVDRRCSELRVYIGKLDATRDRVRLLIEDHQYVLTDLQTKQRVDQLIDPALLDKARNLRELAGDQSELSPQNILDSPELTLAMADAEQATAAAIGQSILPARPEKQLSDLPGLPTLEFEVADAAEQFLLDDLRDHLTTGQGGAEEHLAAGRPEAAIESLHLAIHQVRSSLDAYAKSKPLTWQAKCVEQLDAASNALSEQLAGPYLTAVDQAVPESRKSGDWSGVLDLLEAVVRLAPTAEKLPETLATLDTILQYRSNTEDFDAVVAWERLQEIKSLLTGRDRAAGTGDKVDTLAIIRDPSNHYRTLPGFTNSIGMRFALIPAGEFVMGSPDSDSQAGDDEKPPHKVRITKPFYFAVTEVTQGQWETVMGTRPWSGQTYVKEGPDYAATYVSWDDASEFCKRLGQQDGSKYRLPTEAEWEYACRAGTTTVYHFGDSATQLGDYAWYDDNADDVGQDYAHQVAQKQPNPWGLYDMHGNVWEWCRDWYGEDYYAASPEENPEGPADGPSRVIRGGGWIDGGEYGRPAFRGRNSPGGRDYYLGFRVALGLSSE